MGLTNECLRDGNKDCKKSKRTKNLYRKTKANIISKINDLSNKENKL